MLIRAGLRNAFRTAALLIFALPALSQDAGTQIEAAVRELRQLRLERQGLIESARLEREAVGLAVARLQDDLSAAEAGLESARRRRARIERELRFFAQAGDQADALLERMRTVGAEVLRGWRERIAAIKSSVSEARSRVADSVLSDLESTESTRRAAGLLALWDFLGEELQRAHSLEHRSEPVRIDGGRRRIHAFVARIGLVQEVFVSEDGRAVGVAGPKGWQTDLTPQTASGIKVLVDLLRRSGHPRIVSVPFSLGEAP